MLSSDALSSCYHGSRPSTRPPLRLLRALSRNNSTAGVGHSTVGLVQSLPKSLWRLTEPSRCRINSYRCSRQTRLSTCFPSAVAAKVRVRSILAPMRDEIAPGQTPATLYTHSRPVLLPLVRFSIFCTRSLVVGGLRTRDDPSEF